MVLPTPNMTSDFLKLCQLGDIKNLKTLLFPPLEDIGSDEETEAPEDREPAVDVNMVDINMMPALCSAARGGHDAVLNLLIDANADLGQPCHGGMRALHHACNTINEGSIRTLVNAGADVNIKDDNGNTPLFWCASRGVLACANIVLAANADHKAVNNDGSTLLHRSAANGHVMMCKFWVTKKGLDINAKDSRGDTPLHLASRCGIGPTIAVLVECGADKSIQNNLGKTPVELANGRPGLLKAMGEPVSD